MGLSAESRSSGRRAKLLILKLKKNARQEGLGGAAVIRRGKTGEIIDLGGSGTLPLAGQVSLGWWRQGSEG